MTEPSISHLVFFDALARRYDRTFAPSYADTARDLAPIVAQLRDGDVVVDAGCGTGRAFPHLRSRDVRLVALDASLPMLREAGARASAEGVARVRCDLARRWPLADRVADVVLALHAVLAHPSGDPWRFFAHVGAEIARVARPGALVAIDLPDPSWARGELEPLGDDRYRFVDASRASSGSNRAIEAFVPEPARVVEALGLRLALSPCLTGVRAMGVVE